MGYRAPNATTLSGVLARGDAALFPSPLEPWPLNEQTARVLGLPLVAVTPTARLFAHRIEWLWFDPAEGLVIWQGPDAQHGFPADSLAEALECVERRAMG